MAFNYISIKLLKRGILDNQSTSLAALNSNTTGLEARSGMKLVSQELIGLNFQPILSGP